MGLIPGWETDSTGHMVWSKRFRKRLKSDNYKKVGCKWRHFQSEIFSPRGWTTAKLKLKYIAFLVRISLNERHKVWATNSSPSQCLLLINAAWALSSVFMLVLYKKIWQYVSPSQALVGYLILMLATVLPTSRLTWNGVKWHVPYYQQFLILIGFYPVPNKYKLRAKCTEVVWMPNFMRVLWLLSETSSLFLSCFLLLLLLLICGLQLLCWQKAKHLHMFL